jgi:hypothetical protein
MGGAVDHVAVGLGDLGRPERFLERQVRRWLSELESYNTLAGYPGLDIPGPADVASWLEARRPRDWQPGIMHGDYHGRAATSWVRRKPSPRRRRSAAHSAPGGRATPSSCRTGR